ncbi:SMP-30/gluconolactonase/LRE family protein [Flavisolibacter sp. BT320]|nr:SMP-30/gluconolactonase/LRE family protein [Flavisolibacter longurius]
MKVLFAFLLLLALPSMAQTTYETIGEIERYDSAINAILAPGAKAEVIAEGFRWSEGPLWVEQEQMLLFSDVPQNKVYKWTAEKGNEVYLQPSGYTGKVQRGGEMGSNGLLLDGEGRLVLCQHGDRRMARMAAPLDKPAPAFVTLADAYRGKRISSPNDAVYNSDGELFFTDPPYGLPRQNDSDPAKELAWNGVYKIKKNGAVVLLLDSLTRPNGIAFFPGEKQLLIANSDPQKPTWYLYDVKGDALENGRVFYSVAGYDKTLRGLPDGLKIDKRGNVYASGPGGIYFFRQAGKLLGMLKLPGATSNVALSADEKTLYITHHTKVLRLQMRH